MPDDKMGEVESLQWVACTIYDACDKSNRLEHAVLALTKELLSADEGVLGHGQVAYARFVEFNMALSDLTTVVSKLLNATEAGRYVKEKLGDVGPVVGGTLFIKHDKALELGLYKEEGEGPNG